MIAVPSFNAFTLPLSTCATEVFEEDHTTLSDKEAGVTVIFRSKDASATIIASFISKLIDLFPNSLSSFEEEQENREKSNRPNKTFFIILKKLTDLPGGGAVLVVLELDAEGFESVSYLVALAPVLGGPGGFPVFNDVVHQAVNNLGRS